MRHALIIGVSAFVLVGALVASLVLPDGPQPDDWRPETTCVDHGGVKDVKMFDSTPSAVVCHDGRFARNPAYD